MKATRRFVTSAVLVSLLVVGLVGALFLTGQKPKLGLDLQGGLSVVLAAPLHTPGDKINEAINILRNRVDRAGVAEPDISREGSQDILIQIPKIKNPTAILALIGQTAQLQFRAVLGVLSPGAPGYATATVTANPQVTQTAVLLGAGTDNTKYNLDKAVLTGADVSSAAAVVDPTTGTWSVSLSFKSNASRTWATFTGQLACKPANDVTREIGVVLDNAVQSNPQVNSTVACGTGIASGSTQITGNFTQAQAKNLALVLSTGALPVKLTRLDVQSVSATLGKQSLRAGIIAGVLGLVLVMLYVAIYYRSLGLQTWIGLIAFSGLIYSLVVLLGSALGFTLSLAGIAGLIVSVGITTDSYVVFFERIKEEVHQGKTLRSSVDRGYKSALRTLFTADSVTFFAAVILYVLAIGSVRGFALTLGMATALDVALFMAFTYPLAALLARTVRFSDGRVLGMRKALEGSGQTGFLRKLYRSEFNIDFIGRRARWLAISGVLVAISVLALLPIRGLQFGIDFKGGDQFTVPLRHSVSVSAIKSAMDKIGVPSQQVQIASSLNSKTQQAEVITKALPVPKTQGAPDPSVKVLDALSAATGTPVSQISVNAVSGTWGSSITTKAVRALVVFLIVVILYMSWRLESKMAISGIIALLHDVIITAGVYAIAGLQVTPSTVIAVLTILGYSLYDTVVVFDKIKENVALPSNAKKSYEQIANDSMNQVLMRSINTSLTTLLPVGSLLFVGSFLLGADTLRELALALFVGIAAGTYSSIFVATPLLSIMKEKEPRYAALKAGRLAGVRPAGAGAAAARGGAGTGGGVATAVDTLEDKPARRPTGGGAGAKPGGAKPAGAKPAGAGAAKAAGSTKAAGSVKAAAGTKPGDAEEAPANGTKAGGDTEDLVAEIVASVTPAKPAAPKANRPPQRRPNQSRSKRKKGRH